MISILNAGALRLLVPAAALGMLAEMRTGQRVTIERSLHSGAAGCVDIVLKTAATRRSRWRSTRARWTGR